MQLIALSELFHVRYGVNLEMNRMIAATQGVAFVGRSDRNNGITGRVLPVHGVDPLPAGTITVAGGGSVLATFIQVEPYYSGRDLYYLEARTPMTMKQKMYYVICIRANRYRYNYGRQANRTLKDIQIPALSEIPEWVAEDNSVIFEEMISQIYQFKNEVNSDYLKHEEANAKIYT